MARDEPWQDVPLEDGETMLHSEFLNADELAPQDQNTVSEALEKAIFGISKNDLDSHVHTLMAELDTDEPLSDGERDVLIAQIDALLDKRLELRHRELLWLKRIVIGAGFVITWIGSAREIELLPPITIPGNPFAGVVPFLLSRSNLILALLGVSLTLLGLLFTVRTPKPLSGERTRHHLQRVKSNQDQMQDVLEQQTEFLEALQDQSRAIERIESEFET
ncbi:hypothetical protein [Halorussus marinus]|uniref:hypothetical protein n=1 Tax=Halorussus marinus TaxID=2505976 RepID=UPI00109218B1|nr:hypothetical protein [Halorussus marinus]